MSRAIITKIQKYLEDRNFDEAGLLIKKLKDAPKYSEEYCCLSALRYLGVDNNHYALLKMEQAFAMNSNRFMIAEILTIAYARLANYQEFVFYLKLTIALENQKNEGGEVLKLPTWLETVQECYDGMHGKSFYKLGLHCYEENKFSEALKYFNGAIKKGNKNKDAFLMAGRCLLRMNKPYDALKIFKFTASLAGSNIDVIQSAADAMFQVGMHQEAQELYQHILTILPNNDGKKANIFCDFFDKIFKDPEMKAPFIDENYHQYRQYMQANNQCDMYKASQTNNYKPQGVMRIGLLSSCINENEGLDLIWPAFKKYQDVEIYFYNFNTTTYGAGNLRCDAVSAVTYCANIDVVTLSSIIYNDGLDILINLDDIRTPLSAIICEQMPCKNIIHLFSQLHKGQYSIKFQSYDEGDNGKSSLSFENGFFSLPESEKLYLENYAPSNLHEKTAIGIVADTHDLTKGEANFLSALLNGDESINLVFDGRKVKGGEMLESFSEMLGGGVNSRLHVTQGRKSGGLDAYSEFLANIDILMLLPAQNLTALAWRALQNGIPVILRKPPNKYCALSAELFHVIGIDDYIIETPDEALSLINLLKDNQKKQLNILHKNIEKFYKKAKDDVFKGKILQQIIHHFSVINGNSK